MTVIPPTNLVDETEADTRAAKPVRKLSRAEKRAIAVKGRLSSPWASGIAIVIAILIVLNAQDRKDRPAPTTVTETPSSETAPPPETPGAAPPSHVDHEPDRDWVSRPVDGLSHRVTLHISEQMLR